MVYGFGLAALWVAWMLPGHYRPWTSFQQELLAGAGAALMVLASIASGMTRRFMVPWIAPLLASVALLPLVQWVVGSLAFADDAVLPASYLLGTALVIIAARAIVAAGNHGFVTALQSTFLAAALASGGISLAQWLQLDVGGWIEALPSGERVYGNLTQANHLASLVVLGALAALWMFETRRVGAVTASLVWAFFALVLALTGSRTGWLLVLVVAILMIVLRKRLALRTPPVAIVSCVALLAILVISLPSLNDALLQSRGVELSNRLQSGLRWVHWQALADAVSRSPWTGYGWYQVSAAQQAVATHHPATGEWLLHSHNLVLDLLIYNGIPIGAAIVFGLCGWIASRMHACRDVDAWIAICGCVVLAVHALLEFPLHYLYFLMPMALLIGIIEARHPVQPRLAIDRVWIAASLACLASLGVWIAREYIQVEESWRRAQLKDAGYVTPGMEPTPPDVTLLQGPREIIRFQLTEAREGMSPEELDWMLAVRKRYAQPGAFIRYAVAAGLNGRPDDARQSLVLLCKIWGDVFCDRARKSWPDYQTRHSALQAIAFPVPAAR